MKKDNAWRHSIISAIIHLITISLSELLECLEDCILSLENYAAGLMLTGSGNHSFYYKELLVIFLFAGRAPFHPDL